MIINEISFKTPHLGDKNPMIKVAKANIQN